MNNMLDTLPEIAVGVEILRAGLDKLHANDQTFAKSLIKSFDERGFLSEKQAFWVVELGKKAITAPKPAAINVGDLSGLQRLFDKARRHLKRPAINLMTKIGPLRISVAGASSRAPGTINVAEAGDFGVAKWYGRIQPNGSFEPSPREPTPEGLIEVLHTLGADPAKAAGEHGRLTGFCCFCNLRLTDKRSTAVGYGPKCASNYELPWGDVATDLKELQVNE